MAEFKKAMQARTQPPDPPAPPPSDPHVTIYIDAHGLPRYTFHDVPPHLAYDFVVGACTALCEALARMGRPVITTPPRP